MTQTTAPVPAVAPALPNASIDMNALLANDAAGRTGAAMLDGALLTEPVAELPAPPADEPADRAPQPGDTVTRDEDSRGGWVTIRASWLAEPVKVHGEAAANEKIAELLDLIPQPAG